MNSKQKRNSPAKVSETLTEAQEFKIKRLKSKRKEKHRQKNARVYDYNPGDLDEFTELGEFTGWVED